MAPRCFIQIAALPLSNIELRCISFLCTFIFNLQLIDRSPGCLFFRSASGAKLIIAAWRKRSNPGQSGASDASRCDPQSRAGSVQLHSLWQNSAVKSFPWSERRGAALWLNGRSELMKTLLRVLNDSVKRWSLRLWSAEQSLPLTSNLSTCSSCLNVSTWDKMWKMKRLTGIWHAVTFHRNTLVSLFH